MSLNLIEQTSIKSVLEDTFSPEEIHVTANKGVMLRAEGNTYHVMPTRYGYRITVMDNFEGVRKAASELAIEHSIRNFDAALVVKVETANDLLKLIKKAENVIH